MGASGNGLTVMRKSCLFILLDETQPNGVKSSA